MPFKFKKHLGQNFLIDHNIIQKILLTVDPSQDEHFIEIGAGTGVITKALEPLCRSIKIIEIDKELIAQLQKYFLNNPKIEIIHKNILKVKLDVVANQEICRFIGNLPYNISTPILFHCVKYINYIKDCTFMLQKEVADRICANCNSPSYGRLSIMLQYYFKPEILFTISANCFLPKPKVQSAMIRLVPHKNKSLLINNENDFSMIIRTAFSARRKTIANALKKHVLENDLINCEIDPKLRPENLNLESYIRISNYYTHHKS